MTTSGLAVANALAGLQNGARQVEATINGIGERAGNTSLEETVMAIRTRADYFNLRTDINAREFSRTSLLVSELLGIPVPPNKAIVGANAFSHSSGIHVDGFLKDRQTYEIMRPEDVGLHESRVVLTARTGRAGLRDRLEKLGFTLSPEELNQAYTRFLSIADKKQEVFDEDLMAMVHEELQPTSDHCQLEYLHVSGGTSSVPTASVRLMVHGESREATSTGDGPIDAVYKALSAITHSSVKLLKYEIRSVTSGTEALGEATVHLQQGEVKIVGRGASTDIIEASAKAYVDGAEQARPRFRRHCVDARSRSGGLPVRNGFQAPSGDLELAHFEFLNLAAESHRVGVDETDVLRHLIVGQPGAAEGADFLFVGSLRPL